MQCALSPSSLSLFPPPDPFPKGFVAAAAACSWLSLLGKWCQHNCDLSWIPPLLNLGRTLLQHAQTVSKLGSAALCIQEPVPLGFGCSLNRTHKGPNVCQALVRCLLLFLLQLPAELLHSRPRQSLPRTIPERVSCLDVPKCALTCKRGQGTLLTAYFCLNVKAVACWQARSCTKSSPHNANDFASHPSRNVHSDLASRR